jgi:hypothetical protein
LNEIAVLSLVQFDTERPLEQGLRRHRGTAQYGWALTGFATMPIISVLIAGL